MEENQFYNGPEKDYAIAVRYWSEEETEVSEQMQTIGASISALLSSNDKNEDAEELAEEYVRTYELDQKWNRRNGRTFLGP